MPSLKETPEEQNIPRINTAKDEKLAQESNINMSKIAVNSRLDEGGGIDAIMASSLTCMDDLESRHLNAKTENILQDVGRHKSKMTNVTTEGLESGREENGSNATSPMTEDTFIDNQVGKLMTEALNLLLIPRRGAGSPDLYDIFIGEESEEEQTIPDKSLDLDKELANAEHLVKSLDGLLINDGAIGKLRSRDDSLTDESEEYSARLSDENRTSHLIASMRSTSHRTLGFLARK
mmetsp:Transcript_14169/g.30287  ORF Transcript_14169/g.30287 Transcript_14169/m.30287 type:complete len:235 (-) Transcript_14169:175-879(-)